MRKRLTVADLRIELYGHLIGHLIGKDWRTFDFRTDRAAFEHFELGSTVLSESVPLDAVQNRSRIARRRNFFVEMLPEGRVLTNLANSIRTAEHDVIALLAHFGRDVAGAVQVYDPELPGELRTPHATKLTAREVSDLLQNTQKMPLGNSPITGKSSLAGVQDKIVLANIDGIWHQVHDGYPSTHIIKPESRDYPTMIYDEEFGARIARAVGVAEYATELQDFNGITALVIERYDRSPEMPQGRIHQEDLNQALGAHGNEKYQERGGKVSLRRIAEVFSKNGDNDSLTKLLKLNTIAVAVGNLDLHAKNISVLHFLDGNSTMAPAYDMVPQKHQSNDERMALAVNGKYEHSRITTVDITEEAESWGMQNPAIVVTETLEMVAAFVEAEEPDPRAYKNLGQEIHTFTRNLIAGWPAIKVKTR